MKYLAFGLLLALLRDATIVRMFLVPAIMKMLGDDCWWAPQWMKRIQERLGLGEVELPDERKRPTVREPEEALVGAGAPVRPRPPHDPGHPDGGPPRPGGPGRPPAPPRAIPPSKAGTTRIPTSPVPAGEAPTTRFSAPKDAAPGAGANAASNAGAATTRTPRVDPNRPAAPAKPAEPPASRASRKAETPRGSARNREIESWLGELRGGNGGSAQPSADPTRAMPEQRPPQRKSQPQQSDNEPTTAIPTQRPRDPEATEKIATPREADEEPKRRGGGVSAADLLRREGRL
jgi:trehalose monomycolate/heme transporter